MSSHTQILPHENRTNRDFAFTYDVITLGFYRSVSCVKCDNYFVQFQWNNLYTCSRACARLAWDLGCFPTFGGGERREVAFRVFSLEEQQWDPQPWYLGLRTAGLWLIFLQKYKCQYYLAISKQAARSLDYTLHFIHRDTLYIPSLSLSLSFSQEK